MHTVTKIVSAHKEQGTKTLPGTVDNTIIEVFFINGSIKEGEQLDQISGCLSTAGLDSVLV